MTRSTHVFDVPTPEGVGRFLLDAAPERSAADPILVLGHGAGGSVESADLLLLARHLPQAGISVIRFEQPWRTGGRKIGTGPLRLDLAWVEALGWLREQEWGQGRLFVGGRSAGSRVACRTAPLVGPVGIVCIAFPLHLPGRPESSRLAELLTPAEPRLVLQGTKDAFGTANEVREGVGAEPGVRMVELPGADHSYRVAKAAAFGAAELRQTLVTEVGAFLTELAGTASGIRQP